ncbi:membrane protease HflK [Actinobacillus pleuropneumoniae]|nr:membrane protease HflK [Actinobacillus pleuropneumoniae]
MEKFMSWNESGNQQDPWGKPGQKKPEQQGQGAQQEPEKQNNRQEPPDLEEAFSSLLKKWGEVIREIILATRKVLENYSRLPQFLL